MDVPLSFAFAFARKFWSTFESLGKAKLLPRFVFFVLFPLVKGYSSGCGGCSLVVQGKMLT